MEKNFQSRKDLHLDWTMPNVELVRAISIILLYVQVSSGLKHYLLSHRVHRQTDRHIDTKTHTQTDMSTLCTPKRQSKLSLD